MRRLNISFIWILLIYSVITLVLLYKFRHAQLSTCVSETTPASFKDFEANTHTVIRNRTRETALMKENDVRYGPGEDGTGVIISKRGKRYMLNGDYLNDRIFHGFSVFISDIVSLHRKIPDIRPEACRTIDYPDDMDPISVVIIFRDEWPSVVLRTVYSVLGHSPAKYIKEIVLVDDGSESEELKTAIDMHVANVDKLKVITNRKSLGLMMARQKGIEATTAKSFIVFDGHMEMSPGWLEPVLARLNESPKSLLSSKIITLHGDTFAVNREEPYSNLYFPFFDVLTLDQAWVPYSSKFKAARNGSVAPMPIGVVQGMMIAMRKDFFLQLGGFDPGMRQWGSEQMELSIKVWMCGGQVELVPCSKVAHLYRMTPWGKVNSSSDNIVANTLRTTEVWLDEPYKSLINEVIGQHSKYDIGDLTDRHRIRKENNCKPFQYFFDTVKTFSDVFSLDKIKAKGQLRNVMTTMCLGIERQESGALRVSTRTCENVASQYFVLTENGQIRARQGLLLRTEEKEPWKLIEVAFIPDNKHSDNSVWEYKGDNCLHHKASNSCLTYHNRTTFVVQPCEDKLEQLWMWERV